MKLNFYKKFFEWFNAFGALKFVHFCRDKYYKDIPVEEAAKWVLGQHHKIETTYSTDKDLLLYFRNLDKRFKYHSIYNKTFKFNC